MRFTVLWRESQTRGDEPGHSILPEVCVPTALEVIGAIPPRGQGHHALAIADLTTPERRARWRELLGYGIYHRGIRAWGEPAGKRPASVPP